MEDIYLEALKKGNHIYDESGNLYIWDKKNESVKKYYYLDADAIISGLDTLSIDQFKKTIENKKLSIKNQPPLP